MKKMKFSLIAIAFIAGIAGAVSTSIAKANRQTPTLYYKSSDGKFYPAGIEGYDFECHWDHFSTCTYTLDAATGFYRPYKSGKIVWIR